MMTRLIVLAAAAAAFAAPAAAAPASCTQTPAQIRQLATAKGGEEATKAIKLVAFGERLCAEDAKFEASKKFAAAAKLLGTELAALNSATAGQ